MNALTLLKGLISLVTSVANYLRDKRLMDAGAAESVLKGLNDANDAINRANAARANADSIPIEKDDANRANKRV